jgi:hypothetical protein
MFHFGTGIKSFSNFDQTLELENVKHNRDHPSKLQFPTNSELTTRYPAKQAFLYNEALVAAMKLRGYCPTQHILPKFIVLNFRWPP